MIREHDSLALALKIARKYPALKCFPDGEGILVINPNETSSYFTIEEAQRLLEERGRFRD
jgi:hypothetical protein